MSIILAIVLIVASFIAGILFGRKNPKKVEFAVDKVQDVTKKL